MCLFASGSVPGLLVTCNFLVNMKLNYLKKVTLFSRHIAYGVFLQCVLYTLLPAMDSSAQLHTQPLSEVTVSINARGKLNEVFKKLEQVSPFRFSYNRSRLNVNQIVAIASDKAPMSEVLEQISAQANLNFKRINSNIHVSQLPVPSVAEPAPALVQEKRKITGRIISVDENEPLPGVSVLEKGTTNGSVTDINGNYTVTVSENAVLLFSYIGYQTQEIPTGNRAVIDIQLEPDIQQLQEIIVVGYGEQKKASVVGSIVQTTGENLERTGSFNNLGQALTGQLPGVTTIQSTGEPGADDPLIFIRGQSTWNNAQPLILVDGIERRMNDIDLSEVENISVLKDASATAVFGVKGAEGVILITTKRGSKGKPKLEVSYNTGFKTISRLPGKMDAYNALAFRNQAIENELSINEQGWGFYTSQPILQRYGNPQPGDEYIFPNVDWADEITRDVGISHRANLNITGGSDFAKYFASLSYMHDGDILNSGQAINRPYESRYAYDRFNFRTNLDLNITKTTTFSVNLAGYYGIKTDNYGSDNYVWDAIYTTAPSAFPVSHEYEPLWGYTIWGFTPQANITNPMQILNNSGVQQNKRSQLLTDFRLKQQLDFITKGLSFTGTLSYDNRFNTVDGIFERQWGRVLRKHINPDIIFMQEGEDPADYITYDPITGENDFDFVIPAVSFNTERSNAGSNYRRVFYQMQLNYDRTFGERHNLGAMALLNREEFASGSMFPRYREDWVGRVTYNYDSRYLFEANGAYNGSERFGPGFRFGFFPSVAAGWVISNEEFFQTSWISNLKLRYSIGKVGNDAFNAPRWSYNTQWRIENDPTNFGYNFVGSPYTQYVEGTIGNPNLQWETAIKQNLGIEIALLRNMLRLNVDIFRDDRENIFMSADQRNIPAFFGARPVAANLGETRTRGYEIELNFNRIASSGIKYWAAINYTHAKDEIIYMEDPALLPAYQQRAGFQIGQTRSLLNNGFINNWDEVYASAGSQAGNREKMPGDLRLVDFNGDGVIDAFDDVPFGYPTRPQNTYNLTVGFDYKGFSVMAQFYGVTNVTTRFGLNPFRDDLQSTVFDFTANYWRPDNLAADYIAPRLYTGSNTSTLFHLDGSYLRFKTAEIAYTLEGQALNKVGVDALRIFANGNNLMFWSDLPDDRESPQRSYPMFRRFNLGFNLNF